MRQLFPTYAEVMNVKLPTFGRNQKLSERLNKGETMGLLNEGNFNIEVYGHVHRETNV